jgi:hypothetical protein
MTVPLRSRRKANSFRTILLLASGRRDHGPIRVKPKSKVADGGASETGSNSTHGGSNPLCPANQRGLCRVVSP